MGKEKRHKVTVAHGSTTPSLDAILEESRALRRQMADDLETAPQTFRRMSGRLAHSRRAADPDDRSA